jgi:uncharacterized membrane protein
MPLLILIILTFVPMLSLADSNSDLIKKFTKLNIPVVNIIYIKLTKIAETMNQQYKKSHNDSVAISVVEMSNGIALNTNIRVPRHQFSKKTCTKFLKEMRHKLSNQLLTYMIFPYSPQSFRNQIRWLISHKVTLVSEDDKSSQVICT